MIRLGVLSHCKLCNKSLTNTERLAMFFLFNSEPRQFIMPICYKCYKESNTK